MFRLVEPVGNNSNQFILNAWINSKSGRYPAEFCYDCKNKTFRTDNRADFMVLAGIFSRAVAEFGTIQCRKKWISQE